MRKNELRARSAVKRDLAAIALPTKLQLQKIISELQNLVYSALRTGETTDIEKVCQERLLALLDAGTEVAVLKGGRRGQLSSEKVIDEPISEIMPVRFSLQDKGTVQAQGTAKYLRRISGIDPTRTNNEFRKQNAVLINGLSKEICDTVRKTIVDLTKLGVHVRGGKKEISDILLNAGLDPAATPRLAETIFRTQTAAAYNAGRWNIVNDSDTAPYIWGFQYCTAHDRRVRPEHRLLEGVRLPKDDPFWKRYFPPNGWNCRCTVLEIWNDEETACEDFGITGVDPRKRSPKELNLLPAFDGNAGILGYGRGGSGGGIKGNNPENPKPSLEEAKEVRTEEKEKKKSKEKKKAKVVIREIEPGLFSVTLNNQEIATIQQNEPSKSFGIFDKKVRDKIWYTLKFKEGYTFTEYWDNLIDFLIHFLRENGVVIKEDLTILTIKKFKTDYKEKIAEALHNNRGNVVKTAIEMVENSKIKKREQLLVFRKSGMVLEYNVGTWNKVDVTCIKPAMTKGCVVIHSHPTNPVQFYGTYPSPSDIRVLGKLKASEFILVTNKYYFIMNINEKRYEENEEGNILENLSYCYECWIDSELNFDYNRLSITEQRDVIKKVFGEYFPIPDKHSRFEELVKISLTYQYLMNAGQELFKSEIIVK